MPDEKPNDTAQSTQDEKLAGLVSASVTAGLKTALPELMKPFAEQISGGSIRREAPAPAPRVAQIADVNEDDIANAIEAGDKQLVAKLMRQQRQADAQRREQEIQRITSVGGAAFGSVAKMAANNLPHYNGKYKKLIDDQIEQFQANNPGVMVTFEHYKAAHDLVRGANLEEILTADREEVIRKSREPDPALIPSGGRGEIVETEKEPENLAQVLGGDWKKEFRVKQRAVGGRSDDEELRKFGIAGGLKEFVGIRKEMETLEDETNGSLGLDRDFRDENGRVHGERGFQPKTARFE